MDVDADVEEGNVWLRSGKIRAESAAFFCRVGRRGRSRVVAISRVAQKRQWWVVIGRVEGEGAVGLGSVISVVVVGVGGVGVGVDIFRWWWWCCSPACFFVEV